MRLVLVLGTVSCLIGLSWAAVNATCPTPACDDAKKEVCENGYCKISIEGECTVDQTPTTHTTPAGLESETTVNQGMNGHETTTTDTPTIASTEPTTSPAARKKRRDATQAPITNTHECVNHSLCTKAASSNDLTCQCKDGYAKDDNGFCQEAKSSTSSFRLGLLTSVMATLFYHSSC